MNKKYLIPVFVFGLLAGFMIGNLLNCPIESNQVIELEVEKVWSCYNGCFTMLDIIYDDFTPTEFEQLRPLYDKCADRCWDDVQNGSVFG